MLFTGPDDGKEEVEALGKFRGVWPGAGAWLGPGGSHLVLAERIGIDFLEPFPEPGGVLAVR